MGQIFLFAVLGLGSGAFIAGIATGLVVMYRGSGIINLAMGAQAMVAGYAFWGFTSGEFGFRVGKWIAVPLALVTGLVLGALMEVLAFRRLRSAAPVAKLVASLGILLFLAAGFTLWFGAAGQRAVPAAGREHQRGRRGRAGVRPHRGRGRPSWSPSR